MTRMLLALFVALLPAAARGQELLTIASWNGGPIFTVSDAQGRSADLARFTSEVQPDVLLIQEVTSIDVVEAIRDEMGLDDFFVACSDFEQNDNNEFNSLEVGIISRFPLENVVEFDRSTDNQPGDPEERRLERVNLRGVADTGVGRGFLKADVPQIGLTLIVTHLKSSNGRTGIPDRSNAQKRELVAAAMATVVNQAIEAESLSTVLVAGDFNVGETDAAKNGRDLADDTGDLYDDTHACLSLGLIDGLRMASLTRSIGSETFDSTDFPGTGPIDCIYVTGRRRSSFTLAEKGGDTYGSDHFPVFVRYISP